ncbi:MAG: hypothetical protein KBH11_13485, partial [Bacteroidia bacterium]|nr:hypothetical protein [Bacteroidia bacterium]
ADNSRVGFENVKTKGPDSNKRWNYIVKGGHFNRWNGEVKPYKISHNKGNGHYSHIKQENDPAW